MRDLSPSIYFSTQLLLLAQAFAIQSEWSLIRWSFVAVGKSALKLFSSLVWNHAILSRSCTVASCPVLIAPISRQNIRTKGTMHRNLEHHAYRMDFSCFLDPKCVSWWHKSFFFWLHNLSCFSWKWSHTQLGNFQKCQNSIFKLCLHFNQIFFLKIHTFWSWNMRILSVYYVSNFSSHYRILGMKWPKTRKFGVNWEVSN